MEMLRSFLLIQLMISISIATNWNELSEDEVVCGNTREVSTNTLCYRSTNNDDLPEAEDFSENSIFFIQTVCKGGLNYREACAVESAAKTNPHRPVNVLFAGPVSSHCILQEPFISLASYENIEAYRINIDNYTQGTNLEGLIGSKVFAASEHQTLDAANILKLVTLNRFGGIYLDFDMIVTKSLEKLTRFRNWIGKSTLDTLGTAILALSKNGIGKRVSEKAGSILRQDFGDDSWTSECFSDIMKIAMEDICTTTDVRKMFHSTCKGFRIYPPAYFYPIPARSWKMLYTNFTHLNSYNMYAIHTWNHYSANTRIPTYSLMATLMKKFCPVIFEKYNSPNTTRVVRD